MTHFPVVEPPKRAFRKEVKERVAVDIIAGIKSRVSGTLRSISVTGGCAAVATPYDEGTLAIIRLHTNSGAICGVVQILKPLQIESELKKQPFRFLAIDDEDHQRLQSFLGLN